MKDLECWVLLMRIKGRRFPTLFNEVTDLLKLQIIHQIIDFKSRLTKSTTFTVIIYCLCCPVWLQ